MSYRDLILGDNPVAYWRLGEVSGTTAADETENHDGTYINSPTLGADGALARDEDTAVEFNGTDQSIEATTMSGVGFYESSWEFWFKADNPGANVSPFGGINTGTATMVHTYTNASDQMLFEIRTESSGVINVNTGSVTILDNQWHHFVGIIDGANNIRAIYIDGLLANSESGTIPDDFASAFTHNMHIGARNNRGTVQQFWPGSIDEFAVYDYVLTPAQIKNHHDAGRDTGYTQLIKDAEPVSYWKLDELEGTTAVDEMENHDGTYVNSPTLGEPPAILTGTSVDFGTTAQERYVVSGEVPFPFSNNEITVECWFKLDSIASGYRAFVSMYGTSSDHPFGLFILRYGGDRLRFLTADDSTFYEDWSDTFPISADTWYHFVGVYDGTEQRLYLNGVDVTGGDSTITRTHTLSGGAQPINIGRDSRGRHYLDGYMDEVAVYNYALTPTEIEYHYDVGVGNEVYDPDPGTHTFYRPTTGSTSGSAGGWKNSDDANFSTGTSPNFLNDDSQGTYVYLPNTQIGTDVYHFEVQVENVPPPGYYEGHSLVVNTGFGTGDNIHYTVQLREGTTVRAEQTFNTAGEVTINLTEVQAASINNWNNLRLRVVFGQGTGFQGPNLDANLHVYWAQFRVANVGSSEIEPDKGSLAFEGKEATVTAEDNAFIEPTKTTMAFDAKEAVIDADDDPDIQPGVGHINMTGHAALVEIGDQDAIINADKASMLWFAHAATVDALTFSGQIARPASRVQGFGTLWQRSNNQIALEDHLNDDSDEEYLFVAAEANSGDSFSSGTQVFRLDAIENPYDPNLNHRVFYSFTKTDPHSVLSGSIRLETATQLIRSIPITNGTTEGFITLTPAQVNMISDWADIRIAITAVRDTFPGHQAAEMRVNYVRFQTPQPAINIQPGKGRLQYRGRIPTVTPAPPFLRFTVVGHDAGGRYSVWDSEEQQLMSLPGISSTVYGAAISQNFFALAHENGYTVKATSGGATIPFPQIQRGGISAALSRDGELLAIGARRHTSGLSIPGTPLNNALYVYNTNTQTQVGYQSVNQAVLGVAFSPDGTRLAVATAADVRVYNTETGNLLWSRTGLAYCVEFTDDRLLVGSRSAYRLDVYTYTGSRDTSWPVAPSPVVDLSIRGDGARVALLHYRGMSVVNAENKTIDSSGWPALPGMGQGIGWATNISDHFLLVGSHNSPHIRYIRYSNKAITSFPAISGRVFAVESATIITTTEPGEPPPQVEDVLVEPAKANVHFRGYEPIVQTPSVTIRPDKTTASFQGHVPFVSGLHVDIEVPNTANIAIDGKEAVWETGTFIYPDEASLSFIGLSATVETTTSVTVTPSRARIFFDGHEVTVETNTENFVLVDGESRVTTAADAAEMSNINLGSVLHGSTRSSVFRIGNLSDEQATYVISAVDVYGYLPETIKFSHDNENWETQLLVTIEPNGVSDVIYMQAQIPLDVPPGENMLLLDVQRGVIV